MKPFVQISVHNLHQLVHLALEEVVGVRDHFVIDDDAALDLELLDETGDGLGRDDPVLIAVHHQPRRRAGGEEAEIIEVGERGHRYEAFDLRTPHHQLHRDPCAERDAGDPAGARIGIVALHPIERRGRVGEFTRTVVEQALAAPDATEIEPQHCEFAAHEGVIEVIDDLVVHGAAKLRMGMQNDGDRPGLVGLVVIAGLDAPVLTVDVDFRHDDRVCCGSSCLAGGALGRAITRTQRTDITSVCFTPESRRAGDRHSRSAYSHKRTSVLEGVSAYWPEPIGTVIRAPAEAV